MSQFFVALGIILLLAASGMHSFAGEAQPLLDHASQAAAPFADHVAARQLPLVAIVESLGIRTARILPRVERSRAKSDAPPTQRTAKPFSSFLQQAGGAIDDSGASFFEPDYPLANPELSSFVGDRGNEASLVFREFVLRDTHERKR